jgi:tetratricopeptide (TPR) repeat protein
MRDYDEESAVLHEIHQLSEKYKAISSYNGKTFDIPVLNSRFILNRIRSKISSLPHIDLLHPARRLWRELLPDCRLSTLEEYIFKKTRIDDIPGEQIPYVYFDFLRGLRMQRMRPVLNHNADDIVTLFLVAAKICRMFQNPYDETNHSLELIAVGRCYSLAGEWNTAFDCIEKALIRSDIDDELDRKTRKFLSLIYKKQTRFTEAVVLWQSMVEKYNDLFAHIELAKQYEHRDKQYSLALQCAECALAIVQNGYCESDSAFQTEERIRHRIDRLKRKVGNLGICFLPQVGGG